MKALIIVDVQNDFCPGGGYPVPNGDEVVGPLNELIKKAKKEKWLVVVSRDWHPESTQTMESWKVHCVRNTAGAKFHPNLHIDANFPIISKGEFDLGDSHYSAFNGENINLAELLRKSNVQEVYIGGLAADYCVKNTALDSVKNGFKTFVVWDATRGIYKRKTEEEVKAELLSNKVKITSLEEVVQG